MNSSMVRIILGHILKIEAGFLLLPCLVALIYGEKVGLIYLAVAAGSLIAGIIMSIAPAEDKTLFLKEGCVATALSWILMSIVGSLPFYISREIPRFVDACFETVSGFTTTGSSILSDIEGLTHASLFWRSATHWIGGMGVLVFLLSIVSLSGGSTINLMKAESPGPSVGKLVPKIKSTARNLYIIYAVITIIEMIMLMVGGCPAFDAITLAFGTAGTGGFAIKGDSVAGYSSYVQWVVTVFMILFGINFNAYYLILIKHIKEVFKIEEIKYYLLVILASTLIIFINIKDMFGSWTDAIRHSAFQVASIITTTGFATVDFDTWNTTCKMIIILLMFIGACAGSTGGGIKVSRFVIMGKTILKEINSFIHPKSIKKIIYDGKPAEHSMIRSVNVYMATYVLIMAASLILVSFNGEDLITTATSVITCMNNIGPGFAKLGPTCNFSFLSTFTKIVLMFDMLAGRLELFPLIILFHPKLLRDLAGGKRRQDI
ncbi:MAG: TrkH family potassium uptake protein [Lachnospiraceae bacterium]|nr:TrkH family potassium uptake protein [Lachnospiraceae bacterium]